MNFGCVAKISSRRAKVVSSSGLYCNLKQPRDKIRLPLEYHLFRQGRYFTPQADFYRQPFFIPVSTA